MARHLKNSRAAAALAVAQIVYRGQQLKRTLESTLSERKLEDRRFIAELVNGVVRWFWRLDGFAGLLVERPLRKKDQDVHCLLLTGLYQLEFTRVPQYASINETVSAATALRKSWAGGFLNAVLREFLSKRDSYRIPEQDAPGWFSHPAWMIELVQQQWPGHWSKILEANNARPEMILRVNTDKCSVAEYLNTLAENGIEASADSVSPYGIRLTGRVPVAQLPGFDQAVVSVQNSASQLAVPAMDIQPGHRVLDACAAPGGKLLHILEMHPQLTELTAVDIDETRCGEIVDNLRRAKKHATVITADVTKPEQWWSGKPFDRILIDAPCSALGIVCKHPDIKHHRQPLDIDNSVVLQRKLLDALLPLLGAEGKLLYTTCSILGRENEQQVADAVDRHPEIECEALPENLGWLTGNGRQRLQGVHSSDGFYYASLRRQ